MAGRERQEDQHAAQHPAGLDVSPAETTSCARLIETADWASHPLGSPAVWPEALRHAVSLAMSSKHPAMISWGETRSALYNDAFAALLGGRHPRAFGMPAEAVWGDAWAALAPRAAACLQGEEDGGEDPVLGLGAEGGRPVRHLAVSLMPLRDGAGEVQGLFCPCVDVSSRIRAQEEEQRRAAFMRLALDSGSMGLWQANVTRKTMTLDAASQRLLGLDGEGEEIPLSILDRCVHPQDLDALKTARDRAAREGRFEWEYRIRPPEGGERWIRGVGDIRQDREGRPVIGYGINVDITERRRAEEALKASEARFRTMTEAMPQIAFSATPEGALDFINIRWREFTGAPEEAALGEGWAAFFDPEDAAALKAGRDRCIRTGEWFQSEGRLAHHAGGRRWMLARALPVHDAEGRITRWLGTLTDIDEMKQAQAQRKLLAEELGHRLKNVIALVKALAFQTFDDKGLPAELIEVFQGRLAALGSAHNLLVATEWQDAPLAGLVEDSLSPCGAARERITVSGPDVMLPAKAAVSIALALHELCTNAVKYGALSNDRGRIRITWQAEGGRLRLIWAENGGPAVTAPKHRGFGTTMIERVLAAELGARVVLDFAPCGLRCTVDAPLP